MLCPTSALSANRNLLPSGPLGPKIMRKSGKERGGSVKCGTSTGESVPRKRGNSGDKIAVDEIGSEGTIFEHGIQIHTHRGLAAR